MQMQQEMVDSVVQEIYNDLSIARMYNRKSKLYNFSSAKLYSEKANIIIKCIDLIKKNNINCIRYKVSKDRDNDELIYIKFSILDKSFEYNGFSFHLPKIYEKLIRKVM